MVILVLFCLVTCGDGDVRFVCETDTANNGGGVAID